MFLVVAIVSEDMLRPACDWSGPSYCEAYIVNRKSYTLRRRSWSTQICDGGSSTNETTEMFHRDIDDHRAEEGKMRTRKRKRIRYVEDDEEEKEEEEEQEESTHSASPHNSVQGTPIKIPALELTLLGCPDQHQIPVNCGDKKGVLNTDKLAKGEECIECMGCWYTPPAFEGFGGKSATKKWKQSICYQGRPLGVFFEKMKTVLDASEHSYRVSESKDESKEGTDSDDAEDEDGDDGDDSGGDDKDEEYCPSQDITPLDTEEEEEEEKEEDEGKEEENGDEDEEQEDAGVSRGLSPTDQCFIAPGFEEMARRIGVRSRTCLKIQLEQVSAEEGVEKEEESEADVGDMGDMEDMEDMGDMEQATSDSPVSDRGTREKRGEEEEEEQEEEEVAVEERLSPQTSPVTGVASQTSPLNLKPVVIVYHGDVQSDVQTQRLDTSLSEYLPLSINAKDPPSTVIANHNLPQMSATTATPTQDRTPSIETDHHNNLTDKEIHSREQDEGTRREEENKAGTQRSNKPTDSHYDDNDDDEDDELKGNGQHVTVGNADGMPPGHHPRHHQQPGPIASAVPPSTSPRRRQAYFRIPQKKTPSLSGYQGRQSRLEARERRRERREALAVSTLRRISSGQDKIIELLQRLVDRNGQP